MIAQPAPRTPRMSEPSRANRAESMSPADHRPLTFHTNHPIPTWFGIGGTADRFAAPITLDQLQTCLREDPSLRVLGDGANLLVDDEGVAELVVSLAQGEFTSIRHDPSSGRTIAGAGANLPKLILETVRQGRSGLEGLGGIPASVGGAVIMNAGGSFGQIADAVSRVHALSRQGQSVTLTREQISFSYRHSGLTDLIVTSVEFDLPDADPVQLRNKLKEVMEYKKNSQPMGERSAGCTFKNPSLQHDVPELGSKSQRVSAGMVIDKAGCKGLTVGGASVSQRHANFFVAQPGHATARDVINLMHEVTSRVHARFGITLEPEVVVWSRDQHTNQPD